MTQVLYVSLIYHPADIAVKKIFLTSNSFAWFVQLVILVLCVKIHVKMRFRHARDALVLCHDNRVIDDEEFCLLYDAN